MPDKRRELVCAWLSVAALALLLCFSSPAVAEITAAAAYGRLPLAFEVHRDQVDGPVTLLSRGHGHTLTLTPTGAVFTRTASARDRPAVRLRFVGAHPDVRLIGTDELPGRVNYFIGRDPSRWRTNVPIYARARYDHLYPGVDAVWHGTPRRPELDFIVAPGVDPGVISLAVDGADRLELTASGDLRIRTGDDVVELKAPEIYQDIEGARRQVAGSYVLDGEQRVGFRVAAYDATRTLVIDPVLVYSTYLGGDDHDAGLGIAVDASGSAYVTGITLSSDFPTSPAAGSNGGFDVFVTKFNAAGTELVYSTYIGGTGTDGGTAIAVDAAGNALVTGFTTSSDFPTTEGVVQETHQGGRDAFVAKLGADGSALLYSTYLGGSLQDEAHAIAVSAAGHAYVSGMTLSDNFPTTPGAFQLALGGSTEDFTSNAFVTELDASGATLLYSTYLGGRAVQGFAMTNRKIAVAIDGAGNAYVTGTTASNDFPTTMGAFQPAFGGGVTDAFVAKLDPSASGFASLVYSTYLGGGGFDGASGIAVDSAGSAYVVGATIPRVEGDTIFPSDFPVLKPIQSGPSTLLETAECPLMSAFVTKLDPTGSVLVYSTLLGGVVCPGPFTGAVVANLGSAVALDASGNAYVAGGTQAVDFPTTTGAFPRSAAGGQDAFVTKLDPTGSVLLASTYLGGNGHDEGTGIAVDSAGHAYVVIWTGIFMGGPESAGQSTDFPTVNAFQASAQGGADAIVAKIDFGDIPLQFVTFPALFPSLPGGSVGVPYVGNIGIGGGQAPYTITVVDGALPAGLAFNSPVITGTPLATETAIFTVQVLDQLNTLVEQTFQIPIDSALDNPSPTLTSLVPFFAVPGGSNFVLTANGSNFLPTSQIHWNGQARTTTFVSATKLSTTITAADIAAPLTVPVTVFTPAPGGGTSSAVVFTVAEAVQLTVGVSGAGTVTSVPPGIACSPTCVASYPVGAMVTLTATAAPGAAFAGWSGACSGVGACTVTMTAPTTVNGSFVPAVTLTVVRTGAGSGTVTSSPAGLSCGMTCAINVVAGTVVTLTASPGEEFAFIGWSGGGCTGAGECQVTVSASTTVSALFAPSVGVSFTDDPFAIQTTPIRAVHVLELRQAIDARRLARMLAPFAWTDLTLTPTSTVVKRIHLIELRLAVSQVYDAAALATPTYSDPTLAAGTTINASHFAELRSVVRASP